MKSPLVIFLLLLGTVGLTAQSATIVDADGWTNVREKPSKDSEVVTRVNQGEFFFWVDPDYNNDYGDWIEVYVPKNRFTMTSTQVNTNTSVRGFIHKSRIVPVEDLENYTGDLFSFLYTLEPFNTSGKRIDYDERGEVYRINGRSFFGSDLEAPDVQIVKAEVTIGNKTIPIHEVFLEDIYECDNDFEIYTLNNLFIIHQWNGDGAGAYELTWVFSEQGKLIKRLVGTII